MRKRFIKLFLAELMLLGLVLSTINISFAQGEGPSANAKNLQAVKGDPVAEASSEDSADDSSEQIDQSQGDQEAPPQEEVKPKQSSAYETLGRKLTEKEKKLYQDSSPEELKSQLLYKEQKLVIVRSLLAVGEGESIKDVLKILPQTKPQTYTELVSYFGTLQDKYGDVLTGLETTLVYKGDDEQAFANAASKAYEAAFGVPKEEQDKEKIVSFLKANKVVTYSQMIEALISSMTDEDKKNLLFKVLDEVGRPDLKKNEKFVGKILSQDFTYENLKRLLREIGKAKQSAPLKK